MLLRADNIGLITMYLTTYLFMYIEILSALLQTQKLRPY
jgi:hypothetical protein